MKVRSSVRRMCAFCYVIKRKRVVYIRCKKVRKHKQRQGFHTEAGVASFEGAHAHTGACTCRGSATGTGSSTTWTPTPSLAGLSGALVPYSSSLGRLSFVPAWASTAMTGKATGPLTAVHVSPLVSTVLGKPAWSPLGASRASSPFDMFCWWGASLLNRVKGNLR